MFWLPTAADTPVWVMSIVIEWLWRVWASGHGLGAAPSLKYSLNLKLQSHGAQAAEFQA